MTAWHERCHRHFLMQWCLNLIELCAGQWSVMFGPAANDIFQWGTQIFPGCFLMSVTSVQKFLFVFLVEWNKVFPTCRPASCSPLETVLTVSAAEDVAGTMYICVATPGHGEFIHSVCLWPNQKISRIEVDMEKLAEIYELFFLAQNTQRIQVLSLLCFYVKLSLIHFIQVQFWKRKLIGIFWWPTKYVLNFFGKADTVFWDTLYRVHTSHSK